MAMRRALVAVAQCSQNGCIQESCDVLSSLRFDLAALQHIALTESLTAQVTLVLVQDRYKLSECSNFGSRYTLFIRVHRMWDRHLYLAC
jgi:hypothetical protein